MQRPQRLAKNTKPRDSPANGYFRNRFPDDELRLIPGGRPANQLSRLVAANPGRGTTQGVFSPAAKTFSAATTGSLLEWEAFDTLLEANGALRALAAARAKPFL